MKQKTVLEALESAAIAMLRLEQSKYSAERLPLQVEEKLPGSEEDSKHPEETFPYMAERLPLQVEMAGPESAEETQETGEQSKYSAERLMLQVEMAGPESAEKTAAMEEILKYQAALFPHTAMVVPGSAEDPTEAAAERFQSRAESYRKQYHIMIQVTKSEAESDVAIMEVEEA